jgi:hypothetical protein
MAAFPFSKHGDSVESLRKFLIELLMYYGSRYTELYFYRLKDIPMSFNEEPDKVLDVLELLTLNEVVGLLCAELELDSRLISTDWYKQAIPPGGVILVNRLNPRASSGHRRRLADVFGLERLLEEEPEEPTGGHLDWPSE